MNILFSGDAAFIQALGIIAFGFYLLATQMETKQNILRYSGIGCLFMAANLLLLGSLIGAVTAFIASFRNLIMATDWGIQKKHGIITISLIMIVVINFMIKKDDWTQSFVILGPAFASLAYLQTSMLKVRGFLFASQSTWLANALMFGSIGGILLGLATTSGHAFAICRYSKETIMKFITHLHEEQYHANELAVQYAVPVA